MVSASALGPGRGGVLPPVNERFERAKEPGEIKQLGTGQNCLKFCGDGAKLFKILTFLPRPQLFNGGAPADVGGLLLKGGAYCNSMEQMVLLS